MISANEVPLGHTYEHISTSKVVITIQTFGSFHISVFHGFKNQDRMQNDWTSADTFGTIYAHCSSFNNLVLTPRK
jgi:hypothetical protein